MEEITINELGEFLKKKDIPKIRKNELTFLGISKQPHYENVISNIYAFFLNPFEKHNLEYLLISSLLELIKEKVDETELDKNIDFNNDFEIIREKGTEGRKRIDLLIQNDDNVIIIESKIYHELNNPLGNYWNSKKITQVPSNNKIGILLTLWKQNTNNVNYINITHIEWLNRIFKNKEKIEKEKNKYITLLEDLYENIKNLTNKMKEYQIEFIQENISKIDKIVQLKFSMRNHLIDEVERACGLLNKKLKLDKIRNKHNKSRLRYYRSVKNKDLVFTIVFGDLLKVNGELYIIIELQNNSIKKVQEKYDEIVKDLKGTFNLNFAKSNKKYAHFAHIPDCKPSALEIENLAQFITHKIEENNMLEIFNKIEKYI